MTIGVEDDVKLVVDGIELQTFEMITLNTSMISITTDFAFTYTPKSKIVNRVYVLIDIIKPQDKVEIYINDILYLTGYIVEINWAEDSQSDSITITGMDQVSYCLLRTYPSPKTYTETDYTQLVKRVVADNDFAGIFKVQNLTGGFLPIDNQSEAIQVTGDETAYAFLDRYAKKAQVLLGITGTGEVVIYREGDIGSLLGKFPNKLEASTALINDLQKKRTNILNSTFNYSVLNRANFIEVYSQNSNSIQNIDNIAPVASAEDKQIHIPNKKRVFVSDPTSVTSLLEIAKWHVNIARSQSVTYSCNVQGFSYSPTNKDFWKINTYVQVLDDKRGLNGEFLIASVKFVKDNSGTYTTLTIVNKGSYIVDIEKAIKRLNRNNFASQFQ